ncbi:MAG: FAD-dependent oxidoreductase [Planctomycetota bacterium]
MVQTPSYDVRLSHPQYYLDEVECMRGCPVATDARGYIIAIGRGDYAEGYRIAREPNPFASMCGKVCGAPCEITCRRGKVDETLTIRSLKGFLTSRYGAETLPPHETLAMSNARGSLDAPPTGKRVALIGSGVASLTCAHDLARMGHECHVFEKDPKPGGMLTYGVPLYRLDRELVAREIEAIAGMRHVTLHLGREIGGETSFADLRSEYDAVFIGVGLPHGKRLPLPGADHPDVPDAIEILHDYCDGRGRDFSGRHTLVIGGGNVAMDITRSLLRLGAASVKAVCLERDWEEMPADHEELVDGDAEGVEILPGWGPLEVVVEEGRIRGLRCRKVLSVFNEQGRFAPTFDESDRRVIEADTVIFSVGQASDPGFLEAIEGVEHERGILKTDPQTKQTTLEGVFAGGDVASGPGLFINCIQDGSLAALAIDAYIEGTTLQKKVGLPEHRPLPNYQRPTEYLNLRRRAARLKAPDERRRSNEMIEQEHSEEEAAFQARRCLECHINPVFDGNLCIQCNGCVDVCPMDCLRMVDATYAAGEEVRRVLAKEFDDGPLVFGEGTLMLLDRTACIRCGLCALRCPTDAVVMYEATFEITYQDTGREVTWSTD